MDFYRIVINEKKDGTVQLRPDWKVGKSKDLMTRGGSFYAVWDAEAGMWSTDIYDVQRLVDADLVSHAEALKAKTGVEYQVSKLEYHSSKLWDEFNTFIRNSGSNSHDLDTSLIFADTPVNKEDYASMRLDYSLSDGPHPAWDAIVGTLYNETERAKIEWAIGAVISGDSKFIQKFLVFYGPPASGKSTVLNIIQRLFDGYSTVFDARELAGNNNVFATAAFKSNPLVAIQHDGDLSRIYDNTKLNSIVAHEILPVNEKYKAAYSMRSNAFLFMGTNMPVKISDAKSGIIRRLIDVIPTGASIEHDQYHQLMEQTEFELGAIAKHCLDRYLLMGKNYYSAYRPIEMMLQTDVFFNFVEANYDIFSTEAGISLKRAWSLYKEYCTETGIEKMLPQYKLREELKNYFDVFEERVRIDGQIVRSYYSGFKLSPSLTPETEFPLRPEGPYEIILDDGPSTFDEANPGFPAQYARANGAPKAQWKNVKTTLADIDTSKLHWVRVPENHIVIDFDLVDENGNKSLELSLKEAAKLPATYAEVSKSGHAIHLHYIYAGDVTELASHFAENVEIKTLLGKGALRRQHTLSNNMNVMTLTGGLPKKEKPLLATKSIKSEKGLRDLVIRNIRKEIHPGTKPSIDFIKAILDEAYNDGLAYDLSDMRADLLNFASMSSHQPIYCIDQVGKMQLVGKTETPVESDEEAPLVFFDIEIYPNLFVVCWKRYKHDTVVRMINPTAEEIEPLFKMNLIGFNNRRYDNHMLYARYLGYTIEQLYLLSKRITQGKNSQDVLFREAYNMSYTDIFDFSSKKQSLKRFEIELGILHMELDLPYDQPVPEVMWEKVVDYCVNDVVAAEAVFESRKQDFIARQMLAEISGLSVNHTTQQHTARIIFGDNKYPQDQFNYSDLSKEFPGYAFVFHEGRKESMYRGEITGEGGYVYAEPGIYENVTVLDVASMHPTSIERLDLFGPYTKNFSALKEARMAIKHKDYEKARTMLDGKFGRFLGDDKDADDLAYALKIVINTVYGLTSASFPNQFRDPRNNDNIVAKRGALFMIDLKYEVQSRGFTVAHIKTDSIKIPNATDEIIQFVIDFGKSYGYDFEVEGTYDWFCLVNDAVYIAREFDTRGAHEWGDGGWRWNAVGAQFQHPYVFKTLFTKEELAFEDFCEMKNVVKGTMYLDFVGTDDPADMVHVGRTGSFVPVVEGGGALWRIQDDKKYAVTGTKGRSWITRDLAWMKNGDDTLSIDMDYFEGLKQAALDAITQFDGVTGIGTEALNALT